MGCQCASNRYLPTAPKQSADDGGYEQTFASTPSGASSSSGKRISGASHSSGGKRMGRSNSICSVSSEMTLSQVAAGHGGVSILRFVDAEDEDPDLPKCVMKVFDEREAMVYKELADTDDVLRRFAAEFHGEVDKDDIPQDLQGSRYMKLTNLLRDYGANPHVMDCKLGIRSFVEDEILSKKPRPDLYKRMMSLDSTAPTDDEHEAQAVTKHRWMSFNDSITTTSRLGVRIDGISNSEGSVPKTELNLLQSVTDMSKCIVEHFFEGHDRQDGRAAAASLLSTLHSIREAFVASSFARRHSFVGMSFLFIVEQYGPSGAVYFIDFAKTLPLPSGIAIDHKSPWSPGNHEDGILTGIDNLILCWEQAFAQLEKEQAASEETV